LTPLGGVITSTSDIGSVFVVVPVSMVGRRRGHVHAHERRRALSVEALVEALMGGGGGAGLGNNTAFIREPGWG
jgi:hypothetical protein